MYDIFFIFFLYFKWTEFTIDKMTIKPNNFLLISNSSFVQAYNLCYSTLLSSDDLSKVDESTYEKSPTGHYFMRSTTKKGILPQILDELLAARKRAKRDMALATDPMEKAVQNGRQMALKISANSVYGFTGATVGQLPCVPIAASTTAYGRNLLLETRSFVESTYTIANGFSSDAEVNMMCEHRTM